MINYILYNSVSMLPDGMGYLQRMRINGLLAEAVNRPVVTVVAGAGYGKSQAVASFLQERKDETIWLQLSTLDNVVTRLWEHFIYGISLMNEETAARLISLGFPESVAAFNKFLCILSEEMEVEKRYFVVLDDFHLIYDKIVLRFIANLINSRIDTLTIFLISRSEPEINTVGLSTKGLSYSITEDILRFTESELDEYFKMQDLKLTTEAVVSIYGYTDGWICAIHLIALSLKKGARYDGNALSDAKLNIFKLIEDEIFSEVSEELRRFLIRLSLVDNLTLELIKELSSYNPALMPEMMSIKSFICYDRAFNTYRIHQLFLEFLYEKQTQLEPGESEEIHARAAGWFAKNGYRIDAISHYEKIGHYDEMIKIIAEYSSRCSSETARFVVELLDRVPAALYEEKPIIGVLRAKFLLNNFRVEEALTGLMIIQNRFETLPFSEENKAILGEIYLLLGLISFITCFVNRKFDFVRYFEMADECLPGGSAIVDNRMHLNAGNYTCMVTYPVKGEFDRFQKAISKTAIYMERVMNGSGWGFNHLSATEAAYYQRDLRKAEKFAYMAIYKAREKEQYDIESMAMFYLTRIYISMGSYERVVSFQEQFRQNAERCNSSEYFTAYDMASGWLYTLTGQPQRVAGWIRDYAESKKLTSPITFALDHLVRARCMLAEGKYYEMLAYLDKKEEVNRFDTFLLGMIEMTVLIVVALYQVGEQEQAIETLERAYELAYPDALEMPFIEHGSSMRTIARAAKNSPSCKIPKEWLENIITKASTYAKKLSQITLEYRMPETHEPRSYTSLSRREIDILSDLCHGLTREEMAVNRDVSVNTVKSALQSIYTKLGAVNSLDAVRVATLLKLIK